MYLNYCLSTCSLCVLFEGLFDGEREERIG